MFAQTDETQTKTTSYSAVVPHISFSLEDIREIVEKQRDFFATGQTKLVDTRIRALLSLKNTLRAHEEDILEALYDDLGKVEFESLATELGLVMSALNHAISHVRSWSRPQRVRTPLMNFPGHARIYPEPKGVVLILSPWNYPFMLAMQPLIDALAAGNCVAVKPSRKVPAISGVMATIVQEAFDPEYVSFFPGGGDINEQLLKVPFDHILFTGSKSVGATIMKEAAEHLTPVTLELGGKSPCIVDASANIKIAAERIIWGKCINAGQTCVAPDYVLVDERVHDALLQWMIHFVHRFYGDKPLTSPEYPHIISSESFDRLLQLLDLSGTSSSIAYGGRFNSALKKIEPTIVDRVAIKDPLMQDEIFGPILPIITYSDFEEVGPIIEKNDHPLALYLFTRNQKMKRRVIESIAFGGGAINDTLVHLANHDLPFGGIGSSGMGHYHGKYGFDTFTHYKGVQFKGFHPDITLRNPPYRKSSKMIAKILGWR